jgi:hypothetical protein
VGLDVAFRPERERRGVPQRRRRVRHGLHDLEEEPGLRLRPRRAGSGLPAARDEPAAATAATSATSAPASAAASSSTSTSSTATATATATATSDRALPSTTRDRAQARPCSRPDSSPAVLRRTHTPRPLETSRQGDRPEPPSGSATTAWCQGQPGSGPQIGGGAPTLLEMAWPAASALSARPRGLHRRAVSRPRGDRVRTGSGRAGGRCAPRRPGARGSRRGRSRRRRPRSRRCRPPSHRAAVSSRRERP